MNKIWIRKSTTEEILLDMEVLENAIAFDETSKAEIAADMKDITNLSNPNSVSDEGLVFGTGC